MGITTNSANFLLFSRSKGASFDQTLMLGRQELFIDSREIGRLCDRWRIKGSELAVDKYAESFFKFLGADVVDSIDQSDYEEATIIHNLNKPIPENLRSRYSVVYDGGTLEHVFNFPQAVKNCIDMIKIGGHFISITPANNYCGHGFYQFSPELFFSLFSEQNGFRLKILAITVDVREDQVWYEIVNPSQVKTRITLCNSSPTSLMILAEKVQEVSDIEPFQSDYENIWSVFDSIKNDNVRINEGKWIFYYRKYMPEFLKNIVRKMRTGNFERKENIQGLGVVNSEFYKKINF
jgi:hypothetical protein